MLTLDQLKIWLNKKELSRADKCLVILCAFDAPSSVKDLISKANSAGLRGIDKWNVTQVLKRTNGLAINLPEGWELSDAGKQHLNSLGIGDINPTKVHLATELRNALAKIKDEQTKAYVEETIQCFEFGLFRSAIVMSWVAAFHIIKLQIINDSKVLSDFNKEGTQRVLKAGGKKIWKDVKTTDDLSLIKEAEVLDMLVAISFLGKNPKNHLVDCLDKRNSCGHPNSYVVGPMIVSSHIETLILNVFAKYC